MPLRYIPTLVGRLRRFICADSDRAVHPHACGEIFSSPIQMTERCGTSPRLWGDWDSFGSRGVKIRYIPTLVGRFTKSPSTDAVLTVHPHACGEIETMLGETTIANGTSPRLWGDYRVPITEIDRIRYIPTLVGRLYLASCGEIDRPVHPHACGEICDLKQDVPPTTGTSPRLWGDYNTIANVGSAVRYIPTLVGRFARGANITAANAVHPHACGEIARDFSRILQHTGTSPRLWGDSQLHTRRRRVRRYIPTLVGRLFKAGDVLNVYQVHPHACGEIG